MLDLQQSFLSMVIADIKGEATPEETDMLRADENVEAWAAELEGYIANLDIEMRRIKNDAFLTKETSRSQMEINAAFSRSLAFEQQAIALKTAAKRRLPEAKRLKHEKLLREAQARSLEAQERKVAPQAKKALWERSYLRAVLHEAQHFLEADGHFKKAALSSREALLEEVKQVLNGQHHPDNKQEDQC